MIGTIVPSDLNTTDVILILGFIGILIKNVGEGRGWFKTAANLRIENTDLLRRNGELEDANERLAKEIERQGEKIIRLEEQVRSLEKLDQSAVLEALKQHELGATERANQTHSLLEKSTDVLQQIAASVKSPQGEAGA